MDHLRHLRCFIAVSEERSFTAAAERLNTVQPSLSQQVKRLEEFVGTPLFLRDKHQVQLTEAGQVFLREARDILERVDRAAELARQAARAEVGQLRIGFVPATEGKVFLHVLPALRAQRPGIHLALRGLTSPEQIAALQRKTIDVGFLRLPIDDRSLEYEQVLEEEMLAVLPARHNLTSRQRVAVADLAPVPFIQVARVHAPAVHDTAIRIARDAGVRFSPILETDSILGTLNAAGAGLGFSLLPDCVRQISPATVALRPLNCDPPPRIALVAAWRRDDMTTALRFFLELLRNWIGTSQALR